MWYKSWLHRYKQIVMCQMFQKLWRKIKKLTTHLILYCLISTPFHYFKRTMVLVLFWNEIIYSSHKDDIVAIKLKKVFYKTYCFKLCTLGWVLVKTTEQHKAQEWSFIIWKCATIESFWILNWNFLNNNLFEHFLYQLYTFICIEWSWTTDLST